MTTFESAINQHSIDDKVIRLVAKALEVNQKTSHHTFINYYGHTNSLEIYYYENGWSSETSNPNKKIFCNYIALEQDENSEELLDELNKAKQLLDNLLENSDEVDS